MNTRKPPASVNAQQATLANALVNAIRHHQQGQLQEANRLYSFILAQDPAHFDALHFQGVAFMDAGHVEEGVSQIRRALNIRTDQAGAWSNLGNGQKRLGRFSEAIVSYRRALALEPKNLLALYNLGIAYAAMGQREEALRTFDQALAVDPWHSLSLNSRGSLLHEAGQFDEAIATYEKLLGRHPGFGDAWVGLAFALIGSGQQERALTCLQKASAHPHASPGMRCNLARALHLLGRDTEALDVLTKTASMNPAYTGTYNCRGCILHELKRYHEALTAFDEALRRNPGYAEALNNRGSTHASLGEYGHALDDFDAAIRLRPNYADAIVNAAGALRGLDRFDEASMLLDDLETLRPGLPATRRNRALGLLRQQRFGEAIREFDHLLTADADNVDDLTQRAFAHAAVHHYEASLADLRHALQIRPEFSAARNNYAMVHLMQGHHDEAMEIFSQALAADPTYAEAYMGQSAIHLARGNWKQGFELNEWRWKIYNAARPPTLTMPRWTGNEDLRGRRVLLWSEQGFGDTLLSCRFARDLAARGAEVILAAQPALLPLLASLEGVSRLVSRDGPLPEADFHCPLMSLPHVLGVTLATLPRLERFLHAPAERSMAWHKQLTGHAKLKVGIACSGNPRQMNDHNRSMPIELMAPLLGTGGTFFLLQKDLRTRDADWLAAHPQIHDLRSQIGDFGDTAAIIENLDLVITVDTSVAHLAAALGRPTWILLSYSPDWRYLLDRCDSPFFPSATLYRQTSPGNWTDVMERVATNLTQKNLP